MTKPKLSRRNAVALVVGVELALLALGWFALIAPQRATAKSLAGDNAATQLQIAEAHRPVVQPDPAAVQQPDIRTANLYALAKAMPSSLDTPTLLLELDQVAREAGVTLTTIQPGTASAPGPTGYSTVPINLTFAGDFYSLTDLLYRLRSLVSVRNGELQTAGRLFSVGTLSLGAGTTGGKSLSATVTVDTYLYGGVPAPAPSTTTGATTATSTDTSTTTTTTTTTTPAAAAGIVPRS